MKLSEQITRRQLFVAFGTSQQSGGLSSIDLAAARDVTSVTLSAADGSVAPIAGADVATAGVMTATDKARLDALPPTTAQEFETLAEVEATAVSGAITHLRTAGHGATGDGGGGSYRRVGSEPAHSGKIQSANGSWWELISGPGGVNVLQFGAKGDGATDDTAAFQAAINSFDLVRVSAGLTYYLEGIVAIADDRTVHIEARATVTRPAKAASIDPVFWLKGNNATLFGDGPRSLITTAKDAPYGVVRIGHRDLTESHDNALQCSVLHLKIHGQQNGGKTSGAPDQGVTIYNPQFCGVVSYFNQVH